ncbi:hypothetical protein WJX72_001584 [[Myrmecia] bisecta]|uniref:Structural maintenance of chromosomes protein 5 n=1 Tax=[Myrmecia] bisecta TaxID=41462 RepID=A0AAW1PIF6_9CHLO
MAVGRHTAYVYSGPGAGARSVSSAVQALTSSLQPQVQVSTLSTVALLSGDWVEECAVLVMPGGADLPYCRHLNGKGNALIRGFVEAGGSYLGLCAGAYYACSSIVFEEGTSLEVRGERELGFFPGIAKGCVYPGFQYETENGAVAAPMRFWPAKRPRVVEYARGSIMSVKVHNFMTYADATVTPGPRLNLVLGPNGTGKSSLVCALCIGLAGAPSLLGRADNIKDFIRRGENEGFTEITLSSGDPSRPVVITRHMRIVSGGTAQNEWKINGRTCNAKDIKDKMKEMNVQLDNLCQFLPQDKVASFAAKKPTELLLETEKAVGDSTLYDLHQELIQERNEIKLNESAAHNYEHDLAQLEKQNAAIQRDVDRFQERERLLEEVERMRGKIPYIKYQQCADDYREAKDKYGDSKRLLKQKKEDLETRSGPLTEKKKQQTEAQAQSAKLHNEVKKVDGWCNGAAKKMEDLVKELEPQHFALESIEGDAKKLADSKARLAGQISALEEDIRALPQAHNPAQLDARRQELASREKDANGKMRAMKQEMVEKEDELRGHQQALANHQADLAHLNDVKNQRLQALDWGYNQGIRQLYDWLDKNRTRFRGRVYGPILAEITISNHEHAMFLEQHCPVNMWARFVTEFNEDQELLSAEAKKLARFQPTVSNYRGNPDAPIQHKKGEAASFAQYGITHTLDEVFEAPSVVKHVLNDEVVLSEAYVGTQRTTGQVAERFFDEHRNVACLYTPDTAYRVKTSMYNQNARSQSVNSTRPAKLLAASRNLEQERATLTNAMDAEAADIAELQGELQARHQEAGRLQREVGDLRHELSEIDREKHRLQQAQTRLKTQLAAKKREMAVLEKRPDPRAKEPGLRREIAKMNKTSADLMKKLGMEYERLFGLMQRHAIAELRNRELSAQVAALGEATRELESEVKRYDVMVERMEQIKNAAKQRLKDAMVPRPTQEQEEFYKTLPTTEEELEDLISERSAEADAIVCQNPRVMDEFRERCRKIADTKAKLAKEQDILQTKQARIDSLKERWLPELKAKVDTINATFERNFRQIGCAGQVRLAEHDDYDKFAIELLVKFRAEEEMQVLTANRQSGGERSVSTILYLMSIQNVTVCPFRVVDEINQGMDPINERKVYMQLVESACRPGTPQCFLLTPKLLPSLPYTPDVTILQIMNGTLIKGVARTFDNAKLWGNRQRKAIVAA